MLAQAFKACVFKELHQTLHDDEKKFSANYSTKRFQVSHEKTVSRIMRHSKRSVSCLNTDEFILAATL